MGVTQVHSAFSFSGADVGDVHVVSLRGELDVSTVLGLEEYLIGVSGSTVVIDLDQLTYMDSSGVAAIIGARNRILEHGDELVLTRPQTNVRRVFEITGLDGWIHEWASSWAASEEKRTAAAN